jgi:hypothetical protein
LASVTRASRRAAGLGLALVAIALLVFGQGAVEKSRDRLLRSLATQAAHERSVAAREWLANLLKGMEGQAGAAASLRQIVAVASASADGSADLAATLHDGFRSEPWWETYRRDFSVQGLAFNGDQLDVVNRVAGLDATKLDVSPLIRDARARRSSSAFIRTGAQDWPYAAAAAVVDTPRTVPAVLVLAKSFDLGLAREMVKALDCSIVLTDGSHVLLADGPHAADASLLAGHPSVSLFVGPDLTWGAMGAPLLSGITLWTLASVGSQAAEIDGDAASDLLLVRVFAGLFFLFAAGLIFWPAPRAALVDHDTEVDMPISRTGITSPTGSSGPGNKAAFTTPSSKGLQPIVIRSGNSDPRLRKPAVTQDAEPEGVTALQELPVLGSFVFGRYVLLDLLGEGGMAEVYTAVTYGAERFRRSFVVKRLRSEMLRNPAVVSSFIDEAHLASSLIHSNILPVFDFGKVGDEYYMATEYILGRDFGKLSRRAFEKENTALAMAVVFFVAHQTLEALDYAHNKKGDDNKPVGIVHRDISPNNILVSQRGEVKLFDFGIAKSEGRLTQTAFGMVKGNVRFMSPEQARGDAVDSRSDLFSVGLVIYYALTGDTLYAGDTAYNLLVKAAHGPGEPELQTLLKLPKEARVVLERALKTSPDDRFQTAAEFAAALAPFIAGQQASLGRAMEKLFGPELAEEQTRFATAAGAVGDAEKAEADISRPTSKG